MRPVGELPREPYAFVATLDVLSLILRATPGLEPGKCPGLGLKLTYLRPVRSPTDRPIRPRPLVMPATNPLGIDQRITVTNSISAASRAWWPPRLTSLRRDSDCGGPSLGLVQMRLGAPGYWARWWVRRIALIHGGATAWWLADSTASGARTTSQVIFPGVAGRTRVGRPLFGALRGSVSALGSAWP